MHLLRAMRIRKYAAISAVSTIILAVVYIYTQVLGIVQNLDIWFTIIPWYNAILFVLFAVLFGTTLSYQLYVRSQPKICRVGKTSVGASSGATFIGFLVAQCPACASIGALFLPATIVVGVLTKYSTLINIISIALLLFTLNYLGAFKND